MTDHPDLVTTDQAAAALGVPANVIAAWKARRRITPVGLIPGRGRTGEAPVYRLDELRPLAVAYHQRSATRRTG